MRETKSIVYHKTKAANKSEVKANKATADNEAKKLEDTMKAQELHRV